VLHHIQLAGQHGIAVEVLAVGDQDAIALRIRSAVDLLDRQDLEHRAIHDLAVHDALWPVIRDVSTQILQFQAGILTAITPEDKVASTILIVNKQLDNFTSKNNSCVEGWEQSEARRGGKGCLGFLNQW